MAVTIATQAATDLNDFNYPGSRRLCRMSDGTLWTVFVDDAVVSWYYSEDNGATWQQATSDPTDIFTRTTAIPALAFYIDAEDEFHVAYVDDEGGGSTGVYRRGVWDGSTLTFTSQFDFRPNQAATTFLAYMDIVAHDNGSGTRKVHIVWYMSAFGRAMYSRIGLNALDSPTLEVEAQQWHSTGSTLLALSIDFHHTGDGKTVKGGTPHVFASCWEAVNGVTFRKWNYSGGTWTMGSLRSIAADGDSSTSTNGMFDGTRYVMTYEDAATSQKVAIAERDAADLSTTIKALSQSLGETLGQIAHSYDEDGNVYVIAEGATTRDLFYNRWDRNADTWDGWTLVESLGGTSHRLFWLKRGWYSGTGIKSIESVYADDTASPASLDYVTVESLNSPPTAPTINSPTDGSTHDVNETLLIDWTFNDPDTGDTQSAYTLRRRIGAGSFNYWNGTTWQASEDASTKIATTATQQTLASLWGADGDADHYYSVKTWDAADAGPSSWSNEHRVIPSAQDNPTLTAPANLATVDATETAIWTVSTQTKYRVVVSDTSSTSDMDAGTLDYDTGTIISSSTSTSIEFPTNSVTRYVRVQTWNDEGLASDIDEHQVSVSFTPPSTPTLSVTADDVADTIGVSITNPGLGATETYNDMYRRVVGTSGNGIRIGTNIAVDGLFTDRTPTSGVNYEYRARAFGDNNTSVYSAWTA